MIGDGLGLVELTADQTDKPRHPVGLVGRPVRVDGLVGRQLTRMAALGADDRVLPYLRVIGQRLDVFSRFFFILAMLEQRAAGGPEHCRTLAIGELRQWSQMQGLRIVPVGGHAQRCVEIFEVAADPLCSPGDLVWRSVDTGVGCAFEQDVGISKRHDLLHHLQSFDGWFAGEVE